MTPGIENKILEKLARLESEEGGLPLLLQFYRDLLMVLRGAGGQASPLFPLPEGNDAEAIRQRLHRGIPLLGCDDLETAAASVLPVFVAVRETFQKYPQLFTGLPEAANGPLLTAEMIRAWFSGGPMPPSTLEGAAEITVRAMVHYAFKPLLAASIGALSPYIDPEKWRRRYCPVCGGLPDMAYLDRERGSRWLVCSRCDFAWLFPRLKCPYCGAEDQTALAFFTDDKGLYRLDVCERCKRYVKTIDLRNTEEDVLLPLERLLTEDMDGQARSKVTVCPGDRAMSASRLTSLNYRPVPLRHLVSFTVRR